MGGSVRKTRSATGTKRGSSRKSGEKKPAQRGKRASTSGEVEPTPERRARARRILAGLRKTYPDADCALAHRDAFQLLVATILSAQSTDATVNKVTPELFRRYPTPAAIAAADPAAIEDLIHSTGFFRQKTRSLQGAAQRIVDEFRGKVPGAMKDLLTLPGVARKTANVVLGTGFGVNEGIVVDTHVGRLAHRMGLTWSGKDSKDAVRIEKDLMQLVPRKDWIWFGHAVIAHGRQVCSARKPNCAGCAVNGHCPSAFSF